MPVNTPVSSSMKVKKYLKNLEKDEISREYDYLKAINIDSSPPARSSYERIVYRNPYTKNNDNVFQKLDFNR
jgi:hypothetical protein